MAKLTGPASSAYKADISVQTPAETYFFAENPSKKLFKKLNSSEI